MSATAKKVDVLRKQISYIHKDSISIGTYQRDLDHKRIAGYVKNFNPALIGVLTLNRRPDKTLWCVDGQHRLMACKSIETVSTVPAIVLELGTVKEEAELFLLLNSSSKKVTVQESLSARVARGDEDAAALLAMGERCGLKCAAGKSVDVVKSISSLLRLAQMDTATLERVFPVAVSMCKKSSKQLSAAITTAMFFLERRINRIGRSILDKDIAHKLESLVTYELIQRQLRADANLYNVNANFSSCSVVHKYELTVDSLVALSLLKLINNGRRSGRIEPSQVFADSPLFTGNAQ